MYAIRIVAPDGIVVRTLHLDRPLTTEQENDLLRKYPVNHWIDVSREDYEEPEDSRECWEDDDYYDCYDDRRVVRGFLWCDGYCVPDYWKGGGGDSV